MLEAYQIKKIFHTRMILAAMALPAAGASATTMTYVEASDPVIQAAVVGKAFDGTDLPVTAGSATTEGFLLNKLVPVFNAATSSPVLLDGEELYARITALTPFTVSYFTNIAGVETVATVGEDELGITEVDLSVPYSFKFGNLPEDALDNATRYVKDDDSGSAMTAAEYAEVVEITTLDTLPAPSVAVAGINIGGTVTTSVDVYVNGHRERQVGWDGTNLTWDANVIGYSLVPGADVEYRYLVALDTLAALVSGIDLSSLAGWSQENSAAGNYEVTVVPEGFRVQGDGSGGLSKLELHTLVDPLISDGAGTYNMEVDIINHVAGAIENAYIDGDGVNVGAAGVAMTVVSGTGNTNGTVVYQGTISGINPAAEEVVFRLNRGSEVFDFTISAIRFIKQ